MEYHLLLSLSICSGYLLDRLFGDPEHLPHPIIYFGNWIAFWEKKLNHGRFRFWKGAVLVCTSIILCFGIFAIIGHYLYLWNWTLAWIWNTIFIFFGLAQKTLFKEVADINTAVTKNGIVAGRKQLSRIVGRSTDKLDSKAIKIGALESLAENLSDGVIAPLFWCFIAGVPGLMTYKLINTFDSMVGYKSPRYKDFGCVAAQIDDAVNFLPARITAILMAASSGMKRSWIFIKQYRRAHASPNAGWPESALAGILDIRFGGPNIYHGILVEKPYIGHNPQEPNTQHFAQAFRVCSDAVYLVLILGIITLLREELTAMLQTAL